ncbi:MAG: xylulokinase [Firmicutes bacterium]|nr:xylulokinase [Bacillota bacterium]
MNAGSDLVVGIDLGTSTAKIVVVDQSGNVLGRARSAYGIRRPAPGHAEQSPKQWWEAVSRALGESLADLDRSRVKAIGLSGQLNGIVLVDAQGRPLTEAAIWLDQRATGQADRLEERFGELLRRATYGRISSIHGLAKLLWFMEREPDLVRHVHRVLFPKDYINFRLTGQFATDASDAGATGMLDMRRRDWFMELLDQLNVPAQWLPPVHESPDVIGTLTPEAASELGLLPGIPVVAGAGDMAALAVGTGVTSAGTGCASIATAGHVAVHLEEAPDVLDERLWLMCHAIPGRYFWHGLVLTGGYSLDWFRRRFGQAERLASDLVERDHFELLLEPAGNVPPGSDGLLFLPFLDGAATPYNDPFARAAFIGAAARHGKAHFVRAVLEGVAYNFRDSFEVVESLGFPVTDVRTGEGGSRSLLWRQVMADVLGREIVPLKELDCSALGAACIAGAGAGVWRDVQEAVQIAVQTGFPVAPDPAVRAVYDRGYAVYKQAYDALQPVFHRLAGAG